MPLARDLPSGTVTFLFTDVEGSTRLLHELGAEAYAEALAEHRRAIREACASLGGVEVDTQGDAFFFAFPTADGAVEAAMTFGGELERAAVGVRTGIHTGTPLLADEGYIGHDVHRAARIAAAAHGGQVILSEATRTLLDDRFAVRDLGEHRLKDLAAPERVFQLGDGDFPPLQSLYRTNLPIPANPLVGRKKELADVLRLVRDDARLVTLTGPGGVGKTRFAVAAAGESAEAFPDGVWFVPLSTLRDPALVLPTLASTLGAERDLARHIGDDTCLVVLDNFEHVVEASADVASLLGSCPGLRLLVTSREPLRIAGEQEVPLAPLPESPSIELFRQRVAAVMPDLEVEYAVASAICERLDRLPLAIELAAARTRALTPDQLVERLSSRLDLLKAGRDADPRQQTLRATIEWSYDLLREEEQRVFARLSVFVGGCTLDAAEEVVEADLDTLQSLVEKSLLRFTDGRYWMLETIRDFAAAELAREDDADATFERLGRHLLSLAELEGGPTFVGRQGDAFARLEAEHRNVRSVAAWALGAERPDVVAALIGMLWTFWSSSTHSAETYSWVRALGASWLDGTFSLQALIGAGEVARYAGDLESAVALKEECLRRFETETPGEDWWEAAVVADLADIFLEQGDLDHAEDYGKRSVQLRQAQGLSPARALGSLGSIALARGDLDRAAAFLGEATRGFEAIGHDVNVVGSTVALAEVRRRQGDLDAAEELFADGLRRALALGFTSGIGEALEGLALVADDRGLGNRAARLWGAGQALLEAYGLLPTLRHGARELDASERAEGAAMTLDQAVEYALSSQD